MRGQFAEGDTGKLKAAKERTSSSGHAATVHKACRAGVTRELAERGVVFLRLQLSTQRSEFLHCCLLPLISFEPCCLCHRRRRILQVGAPGKSFFRFFRMLVHRDAGGFLGTGDESLSRRGMIFGRHSGSATVPVEMYSKSLLTG